MCCGKGGILCNQRDDIGGGSKRSIRVIECLVTKIKDQWNAQRGRIREFNKFKSLNLTRDTCRLLRIPVRLLPVFNGAVRWYLPGNWGDLWRSLILASFQVLLYLKTWGLTPPHHRSG